MCARLAGGIAFPLCARSLLRGSDKSVCGPEGEGEGEGDASVEKEGRGGFGVGLGRLDTASIKFGLVYLLLWPCTSVAVSDVWRCKTFFRCRDLNPGRSGESRVS